MAAIRTFFPCPPFYLLALSMCPSSEFFFVIFFFSVGELYVESRDAGARLLLDKQVRTQQKKEQLRPAVGHPAIILCSV